MPLAPYKDRTIRLTLESEFFNKDKQGNLVSVNKTSSFADKFLPTTGLAGVVAGAFRKAQGSLILKGPTSLNAGFSAGIADEAGLATTFLEAWFIRNSPIKIKGESYLGTFAGLSVSDKDASGLLKLFYTSLRDFSNHLGAPGTKERFILEIANNPEGSARFIGFIRDFNFTEDVKKPYILDYDLEFIGKSFDQVAIGIGKQGAQTSTRMFNGEF